jgi:hypothetical protein
MSYEQFQRDPGGKPAHKRRRRSFGDVDSSHGIPHDRGDDMPVSTTDAKASSDPALKQRTASYQVTVNDSTAVSLSDSGSKGPALPEGQERQQQHDPSSIASDVNLADLANALPDPFTEPAVDHHDDYNDLIDEIDFSPTISVPTGQNSSKAQLDDSSDDGYDAGLHQNTALLFRGFDLVKEAQEMRNKISHLKRSTSIPDMEEVLRQLEKDDDDPDDETSSWTNIGHETCSDDGMGCRDELLKQRPRKSKREEENSKDKNEDNAQPTKREAVDVLMAIFEELGVMDKSFLENENKEELISHMEANDINDLIDDMVGSLENHIDNDYKHILATEEEENTDAGKGAAEQNEGMEPQIDAMICSLGDKTKHDDKHIVEMKQDGNIEVGKGATGLNTMEPDTTAEPDKNTETDPIDSDDIVELDNSIKSANKAETDSMLSLNPFRHCKPKIELYDIELSFGEDEEDVKARQRDFEWTQTWLLEVILVRLKQAIASKKPLSASNVFYLRQRGAKLLAANKERCYFAKLKDRKGEDLTWRRRSGRTDKNNAGNKATKGIQGARRSLKAVGNQWPQCAREIRSGKGNAGSLRRSGLCSQSAFLSRMNRRMAATTKKVSKPRRSIVLASLETDCSPQMIMRQVWDRRGPPLQPYVDNDTSEPSAKVAKAIETYFEGYKRRLASLERKLEDCRRNRKYLDECKVVMDSKPQETHTTPSVKADYTPTSSVETSEEVRQSMNIAIDPEKPAAKDCSTSHHFESTLRARKSRKLTRTSEAAHQLPESQVEAKGLAPTKFSELRLATVRPRQKTRRLSWVLGGVAVGACLTLLWVFELERLRQFLILFEDLIAEWMW